jgi:PAS domain S-box-containing protein
MTSKDRQGEDAAELRRQAEKIARERAALSPENQEALSPEEARQTLHELQVHQIELEMQNEELRRAHVELDASRARYFDLYDLAPVGYFSLSQHGLILEANLTAAGLLGVPRSALAKQPITRFVPSEDQDIYYRHRKQLLETGAPQVCELRMRRVDAAPFWARFEATAVQDGESGEPVCRVVVSDITDRKRAEEALHEANEELEQRVRERTSELNEANEELQREFQTLKLLLQSNDHERQLIAYEIHDGLSQQLAGAIMQLQAYEHSKDTQPQLAADAFLAGMAMLRQSHAETRRLIAGVRPPILDESGVMDAIAYLVYELGRDAGTKVTFDSKVAFDRLPPILENAMYRIAQEGLANACHHSKSENVCVRVLEGEDHIRIEIRDWGIGFDAKNVPENRFGLEGIRQRVRLLGGKYSIRSTIGEGTRITVELPLIKSETVHRVATTEKAAP